MEHHEAGGFVDLASPGGDGGVGVAGPDRVEDAGVVRDDSIDGVLITEPQQGDEEAQLEGEAYEHGFESGHTCRAGQFVLYVQIQGVGHRDVLPGSTPDELVEDIVDGRGERSRLGGQTTYDGGAEKPSGG